jgi:hypothetical protein
METSLIRHSKAIAARAANSTAFRFSTGKAPGSPRHTGHTFVFGGSPKRVEHEQKIFDAVRSCTWTSSPMTGSYFASKSSEMAGVVAISGDYIWRGSGEPGVPARPRYCRPRIPSAPSRTGEDARHFIEGMLTAYSLLARSGTSPSGFRNTSAHCPSRHGLPSGRSWRRPADSRCQRYRKTESHAPWNAVRRP